MNLLLCGLDRIGCYLNRQERDIKATAEALVVYVQLWFAHTPRIGDNEKDAAHQESWNQYQKFVDYVAKQMAGEHRFIDDLVQDVVGNEEELKKALNEELN